jgi:LAO/AO transport system kinase
VATTGQGTDEVVAGISRFRACSKPAETGRRRVRSEHRLRECLSQRALSHIERDVLTPGELAAIVDRIASREVDPYTAADELLKRALAR